MITEHSVHVEASNAIVACYRVCLSQCSQLPRSWQSFSAMLVVLGVTHHVWTPPCPLKYTQVRVSLVRQSLFLN